MTTTEEKAINVQLRNLRATRKVWVTRVGLHVGEALTCNHRTYDADCEACPCRLWRADRIAEIDTEIRRLTGQPEPEPAPKPVKAKRRAVITKSTGEQLALLV